MTTPDLVDAIAAARRLLDEARSVTVLTGAGISTDSGIPDFRGPNGLWTRNPEAEKASDIRYYVADPEVRKRNWAARVAGEIWVDREPNDGHRALVRLEQRGILHTLITQNVDGLHQKAGSDPARIVEVHGNTRRAMCLSCDYRDDIEVVLARVRAGEADPACQICGGILKSATVSFGQPLDPETIERAQLAAESCDVFLAIGTTLAVYPVAGTVPLAKRAGARVVIVNGSPTEMDDLADVVVRGPISEVLPAIIP
ncbi:MAG TPA: NAD-dependent deacylase [Acidimicrobiales bacterium]